MEPARAATERPGSAAARRAPRRGRAGAHRARRQGEPRRGRAGAGAAWAAAARAPAPAAPPGAPARARSGLRSDTGCRCFGNSAARRPNSDRVHWRLKAWHGGAAPGEGRRGRRIRRHAPGATSPRFGWLYRVGLGSRACLQLRHLSVARGQRRVGRRDACVRGAQLRLRLPGRAGQQRIRVG